MSETINKAIDDAFEQLLAAYDDAEDILKEIFTIFAEEAPEKSAKLDAALAASDFAVIGKVAHSFANTTGTFNIDPALQLSRSTEQAAREHNIDAARRYGRQLLTVIEVLLGRIQQWLDGR